MIVDGQTVTVPGTQTSPWNPGTNLYIGMPGTGTVNILTGGSVTLTNIIAVGRSGIGNLNVSGGGQGKASTIIVGNLAGSTGTAVVTGTGSALSSTGMNIGLIGNGTLNVEDGSVVTNSSSTMIGSGADATGLVTVTGAGSILSSGNRLVVGGAGEGTLNIENGAHVANTVTPPGGLSPLVTIGQQAGSTGTVVVTGAGSSLDAGAAVTVGDAGLGQLRIEDGATGSASDFVQIASQPSSNGSSMIVTGAGSAWTSNGIMVGGQYSSNGVSGGKASLLVEAGGQINTINGAIGYNGTSSIATVTGAGSKWIVASGLTVESSTLNIADGGLVETNFACFNCYNGLGTGKLNVSGANAKLVSSNTFLTLYGTTAIGVTEGAGIESGITQLSYYEGSKTDATVSGAGSNWTVTDLTVARLGTASLTVEDGGKIRSASATLGQLTGSSGTATLSGVDSSWQNTGALVIADNGTASLTVKEGATVTSGTTTVARFGGSNGTVTVTGTGSTLGISGDMYVGNAGSTGILNLTDGGEAAVSGTVGVGGGFSPNGMGTVNIGTGGIAGNLSAAAVKSYSQSGATINFNHTDNIVFTSAMTSAAAGYSLAVNQMNAGTTTLTGASTYSGLTKVSAGTLQAGVANAFSSNSDVEVTAGVLDANGFNQTVKSLANAGTVATNLNGGSAGTTLTVASDYIGNGGTLVLNTFLASDYSPTDELIVNGDVSGTTKLVIRNAGGHGAATTSNGIEVVHVAGTSTSDAFALTSAVSAGAYDYSLYLGGIGADAGNQNWYLRSAYGAPLSPTAQTVLPYADVLSHFAQSTLATLQQRTGNRIWPQSLSNRAGIGSPASKTPDLVGQGAWGRIVGQYASYDPVHGASYKQAIGFLQAGYEGVARETAFGDLTLGAYATIGTSRSRIDVTNDPVSGAARAKGRITTNAYGLGANATWLGHDGFYADAIGQFTWYDSGLTNKVGRNPGWSTALSLETGKRFDLGSGWAVVPQAQLAWTHAAFEDFVDTSGNQIVLGKSDSLLGRAGLRLENLSIWQDSNGQTRRLQFYGIANLTYEFLDGSSVKVAGTTVEQRNQRLWGEVGLGGTYSWNDDVSLYAEASYATALSGKGGHNRTIKATTGLRYAW